MNKKMALLTAFFVVLIDLMGFGIVLPLLPFYASEFGASGVLIGLLYSVYSLSQLIFSPLWGAWSDRIGRRPIMLLSTFGSFSAYLLFAFSHSLGILFFSRILAGVMGGNISTAQAYVADVTDAKDRAKGMGLIGAAFGIGFVLGPALATLLIHPTLRDYFSDRGWGVLAEIVSKRPFLLPGLLAALLSLISFLLVFFKLPESKPEKTSEDATRIQKNSIFTALFWKKIFDGTSAIFPLLLLAMLVLSLGQSSLYSAFPLFCKTIMGLSPEKVGMQFVAMGLVAIVVQGGLIRILLKKISEKRLFFIGNIFMMAGLGLIPFAGSEKTLMLFLCVMSLGGSLNGPTLTSLLSKQADPENVGSAMGSSQAMSALGRVIGPTWGGFLFGLGPALPFVMTAALLSLALWVGTKIKAAAH